MGRGSSVTNLDQDMGPENDVATIRSHSRQAVAAILVANLANNVLELNRQLSELEKLISDRSVHVETRCHS